MRDFVIAISHYGQKKHPGFITIPQNGNELISLDGKPQGALAIPYVKAIQGMGREDLFFGYTGDNKRTPQKDSDYMLGFLKPAQKAGITILAIDYASSFKNMDASYTLNQQQGFLGFAANRRELDNIPVFPKNPPQNHFGAVTKLNQAKNFLYLINPQKFATKEEFVQKLLATTHDVLIVDLYVHKDQLGAADVTRLQKKPNGAKRLVIAYMSIGEAETYRPYWQKNWQQSPPPWLDAENPHWKGNFKVKYWHPEWQKLTYGAPQSYLDTILKAGFDGVYLDIVDAFWYFENKKREQSVDKNQK